MNRFRRILMRWDKKPANYLAFLHFAYALISFRAAALFGSALRDVRVGCPPAGPRAGQQRMSRWRTSPVCYNPHIVRRIESMRRMATGMPDQAAHKSKWETADVVFGLPFLLAIALQFVVPLSLPRGSFRPAVVVAGFVLCVVGFAFMVLARRELTRGGQPADPGLPTTRIVTNGVFAISRNPLYFGAVCFLCGLGLAANLPWALVLLLPSLIACHYVLIAPEERYLVARFGEQYRAYTATVNRWVGRARSSS
jgi:protein-S-isoprenylcysteine O-methyltransferase Ste14